MFLLATIALIWLAWQVLKLVGLLIIGALKLVGWTVGFAFKALWVVPCVGLVLWLIASFATLLTPVGIGICALVGALLAALGHGQSAA